MTLRRKVQLHPEAPEAPHVRDTHLSGDIVMLPVQSSNITHVGFRPTDTHRGTLRVKFKDSGVYEYSGVTHEEAADLAQAKSVGTYFHQQIKSKYPGRKV